MVAENNIINDIIKLLEDILQCKLDIINPKYTYDMQNIGMDSILYLKFLSQIERHFDIDIKDELWDFNQCKTIWELADYITMNGMVK